jgi:hypothetical protein
VCGDVYERDKQVKRKAKDTRENHKLVCFPFVCVLLSLWLSLSLAPSLLSLTHSLTLGWARCTSSAALDVPMSAKMSIFPFSLSLCLALSLSLSLSLSLCLCLSLCLSVSLSLCLTLGWARCSSSAALDVPMNAKMSIFPLSLSLPLSRSLSLDLSLPLSVSLPLSLSLSLSLCLSLSIFLSLSLSLGASPWGGQGAVRRRPWTFR